MEGRTNMAISKDLLEAYKGYYETDLELSLKLNGYKDIEDMIRSHSPQRRLEVYLEWNGIIGYANRAFEIATGEL